MIERHGKAGAGAAMVYVELLPELEDRMDLADILVALAEAKKGSKPLSVLKKELGL